MGVGSEKCLVMKYERHRIYLTNLDSTAYYYNIIVGAVLLLYDWQRSSRFAVGYTSVTTQADVPR